MNKYGGWVFIGLFVMVCISQSCKNGIFINETPDGHLAQLDTIMNVYNAKRDSTDRTKITEGKVNITVKDNLITIDHYPERGEELITYFLQGSTKNDDLKTDSLGRSEVLFLGRNLIVHSFKEKKVFLFTVIDDTYPSYLKVLSDRKQYLGYGLGARKFTKNGLHDNVPFCQCRPMGTPATNCGLGDDGGAHGCGTGTPDGSCEVSCSLSAYACCDVKI